MWYAPLPSVTALRTFSISTGLDASTVTPGSTAPDESLTTPVTLAPPEPCASADMGRHRRSTAIVNPDAAARLIAIPSNLSFAMPAAAAARGQRVQEADGKAGRPASRE